MENPPHNKALTVLHLHHLLGCAVALHWTDGCSCQSVSQLPSFLQRLSLTPQLTICICNNAFCNEFLRPPGGDTAHVLFILYGVRSSVALPWRVVRVSGVFVQWTTTICCVVNNAINSNNILYYLHTKMSVEMPGQPASHSQSILVFLEFYYRVVSLSMRGGRGGGDARPTARVRWKGFILYRKK